MNDYLDRESHNSSIYSFGYLHYNTVWMSYYTVYDGVKSSYWYRTQVILSMI